MRKRVLIAEPSEITIVTAETVLRQNGFEVIAVSSGDMALQILELSKPHLIIANGSLPGEKQVQIYPGFASRTGAFRYFCDITG